METTGLSRRATLTVFGVASALFLALSFVLTQMTHGASRAVHMAIGGLLIVLAVVYVAGMVVVVLRRWQARDEMARAGNRWAMHWGTLYGLAVAAPAILGIIVWSFGRDGANLTALMSAVRLPSVLHAAFGLGLAAGALAILVPMLIGQLVMLGLWWWKHR
ncbi:MAG: hypothetical protein JF615_12770 [Asticcacaulis sp.]|nr:hypothetical protein [Asticcacaulis sp.]